MKLVVAACGAAVVLLLIAGLALAAAKSRGMAPRAGLANGRLAACPASPNCASSEPGTDAKHAVTPLGRVTWNALVRAVKEAGGRIIRDDGHYLQAEFRSPLFGFVDDFEARRDAASGIVHVRSASRVGHSDLGANARRIARLRERLAGTR